jgi:hypothetical protein|tara:strand:+ start:1266 stop:1697 length:432 start_codon:yes stop_codon:yes gene_type:complete
MTKEGNVMEAIRVRLYRAVPCQDPSLDDKIISKWFLTAKEAYQWLRNPDVWGGYLPMIQEVDIDVPDLLGLADLLSYNERFRFDLYPTDGIESMLYINDEWSRDSKSDFLKKSWTWHEKITPKDLFVDQTSLYAYGGSPMPWR